MKDCSPIYFFKLIIPFQWSRFRGDIHRYKKLWGVRDTAEFDSVRAVNDTAEIKSAEAPLSLQYAELAVSVTPRSFFYTGAYLRENENICRKTLANEKGATVTLRDTCFSFWPNKESKISWHCIFKKKSRTYLNCFRCTRMYCTVIMLSYVFLWSIDRILQKFPGSESFKTCRT